MTQMVLWFLMVALYSFPVQLLAGDGTCSNKVRTCIEGPETRMISGWPVTRSCWKYESKYDCISQNYVDECGPLVDQGVPRLDQSAWRTWTVIQPNVLCTSNRINAKWQMASPGSSRIAARRLIA